MATIQASVKFVDPSQGVKVVSWTLTNTGDVGAPFQLGRYAVTSFQIVGNAPTALALNGSNDSPDGTVTNLAPLSDWQGNSLGALNALGFKTPRDLPLWIGATLTTAGAGATTVQVSCHRTDMGVMG